MSLKYVPLHSHTDASISDGMFGPKKWAKAFKELGFQVSAITDHGTMANVLPLYKLMKEQGLTLIVGCEFYYVDEPLIKTNENRKNSHLILLAKNYEGYQNLLMLMALSYSDGYYYKNRIGLEWLKKYSENLVCLTACQGGVLANQVWRERRGEECFGLVNKFNQLKEIFGDDLYVEFQGHNTPNFDKDTEELFCSQAMINTAFYEQLRHLDGFKPIVTNDSHYILPDHAKIQRVMKDMAYGKADSGESATVTKDHFTDSLWLKNHVQVYEAFRKHHEYLPGKFVAEGIRNTVEVFEKCKDFEMPKGKRYLPNYRPTEVDDSFDGKAFFKQLATKKLGEFLKSGNLHATKEEYMARFKKEYKVIHKYGLEDYFLIVWDLIKYANDNDSYTGLGRGSAAGCLISYLLGIVRIDPLEHGLIFERFLNEVRCESGELPDIDTDFESKFRQKVKKYTINKYGKDKTCDIGTYGRMKLKTSILDFGKAYSAADHKALLKITTSLDLEKEDVDDLMAAIEQDPELERLMEKNPDYAYAVTECIGSIKSQGLHPAGLIICNEPVATVTPVKTITKKKKDEDGEDDEEEETEKRVTATQSEDKHVIAQGLMKVDILGVKQYDIVHYVIANNPESGLTRDNYVEEIMRMEREKPNKKVWKMFQTRKTEGVFQFSSSGMQELLENMRPTKISELTAANALYRPACLENGWHTDFCNRKHGLEPVSYVHEDVESVLAETYGVIVYQEQFMEVFHKVGGISLVESDIIRSALGKKDLEKLKKFKEKFIAGASKKISAMDAEHLWEQIEKAAGYSFNKSHSASYAVLAYISQYLKVTYPEHFWCANLYWAVIKKKPGELEAVRKASVEMGIEHVLPDINKSKNDFYVETGKIVWGFRSVKGVGPQAAADLERLQPYASFDDFMKKIRKSKIKVNNIEGLIVAGAFDEFGDRKDLLFRLYDMKATKKKPAKEVPSEIDLILKFRETMGFFEQQVKRVRPGFSRHCITEAELREYDAREAVIVGGIITHVSKIKTKKGDTMAFLTIEDMDESIEVTLFPSVFDEYKALCREGKIVEIRGIKSAYNGKQNAVEASVVEER